MRAALIAIAALTLGGCSGNSSVFDLPVQSAAAQPTPVRDNPESYYKYLVAAHATPRALRASKRFSPLHISPLQVAVAPQPGDWVTCLRTYEYGKKEVYFAMFIRNREIIEIRSGIAIDRCESEQYTLLPELYEPPPEPRPDAKTAPRR